MIEEENILQTIQKSIPPVHPEGWKFITVFILATLILGSLSNSLLWVGGILTLWCTYFFRDPIRTVPEREGLIVSPADGLVQKITTVIPPLDLKLGSEERVRISIFLNVFDVHINRIPIRGTVRSLHYHPGAFFNASLDKASEENERQYITLEIDNNQRIGVVQIAGLIARRILCTLHEGQQVTTGARLGLIRFGSRVDVYLPAGVAPLVIVGQRAVGGETILADLQSSETERTGTLV